MAASEERSRFLKLEQDVKQRGKSERWRTRKERTLSVCFCKARGWLCAYGDDGRHHEYTQSAESATVTLIAFFPPCSYICVCWCVRAVCRE